MSDPWRPMQSAPRDGTPIELMNTYGVAPWYGLFRWTDQRKMTVFGPDGASIEEITRTMVPAWVQVGDSSSSVDDERYLHWRPYRGDPGRYVDPTGGAQFGNAYWQRAVEKRHGLQPNYFGTEVEQTPAPHATRRAWWQRLLGWPPL